MNATIRLGGVADFKCRKWKNPQYNSVFAPDGTSPTVDTRGGAEHFDGGTHGGRG